MEDKKMLEIIHNNCKKEQIRRKVAINSKNNEKREKKHRRIEMICIILAFTIVVILGIAYKQNQVKECIKKGHSEIFCKYGGE